PHALLEIRELKACSPTRLSSNGTWIGPLRAESVGIDHEDRESHHEAREALVFPPSMTNKVGDDHPDDDGECGGEDDTDHSSPHAFRGIIKAIKFAQHYDIKAL